MRRIHRPERRVRGVRVGGGGAAVAVEDGYRVRTSVVVAARVVPVDRAVAAD